MATTFDLSVIFKAVDKMSAPMNSMQSKLKDFGTKAAAVGQSMKNIGQGMMTYITAPVLAIAGIGLKEFSEQEEALFRLQNAIKLTGREGTISVDALAKLADELQGVTKFSDDASLAALALVEQMGGLSEVQLKEVLPAMQDFASMMNMDLQSAANIFGKSLSTGNNYLKRNGILFEESRNKAQFFKNMMEAVSKKTKGTAMESAQGLSGALFQLKNNFLEIAETVGQILAPAIMFISKKFRQFKDWFNNLNPALQKFIVIAALVAAGIGVLLFVIGSLLTLIPAMIAGWTALNVAFAASPIGWVVLAIMAAVAVIVVIIILILNWKKVVQWLTDKWMKLVDWLQRMPRIILILLAVFAPFIAIPVLIIRNWEAVKNFFMDLWQFIWDIFDNGWVQLLGSVLMPLIGIPLTIIKNWDQIATFFVDLWDGIVNTFTSSIKWIQDIWKVFTEWAMKNPLLKWLFETKQKSPEQLGKEQQKKKEDEDRKKKEEQDAIDKKNKEDAKKKKRSASLLNMDEYFQDFSKKKKEKQSILYVNVKVAAEDGTIATISKVEGTGNIKKKVTTNSDFTGASH
jgi:hypothetical protein